MIFKITQPGTNILIHRLHVFCQKESGMRSLKNSHTTTVIPNSARIIAKG